MQEQAACLKHSDFVKVTTGSEETTFFPFLGIAFFVSKYNNFNAAFMRVRLSWASGPAAAEMCALLISEIFFQIS